MFSIFSAYHITILGYFEFLNMLAWRSYAIINIPSMLKFNSPQEPHCKGHSGDVETNCSQVSEGYRNLFRKQFLYINFCIKLNDN